MQDCPVDIQPSIALWAGVAANLATYSVEKQSVGSVTFYKVSKIQIRLEQGEKKLVGFTNL